MDAAGKRKKKDGKRRALKRANTELELRLGEIGSRLADATARAASLEAGNAELAARLAVATAELEAERRRFDAELRSLGEDVGNALADRAAAELRAEEAARPAIERLSVERGQLAVELSQSRAALATALAEVEQLNSHVAQLRAALDDTAREQQAHQLRVEEQAKAAWQEEIGIALAGRAAAELRLEEAEDRAQTAARAAAAAAAERDGLNRRVAELETARSDRESLREAVAGLQDRLVQATTELSEAVVEHNRQLAAWYAERETWSRQRARLTQEAAAARDALAQERDALGSKIDRMQGELARAVEAGVAAAAENAELSQLAETRAGEIAGLAEAKERLDADQEQWRLFAAGAARLVDGDAANAEGPLGLLECIRRRQRELEVALDRAEVERARLDADLAAQIAAAQMTPLRKLHRRLRQLLGRRTPVAAASRG